ncbi:hypothetical protein QTJ16_003216 [Diplocarpon rosae]|uniref:Uncharacterized protein n=1 Tax=Diplocarpon rosae TaxID=946125 RepID=A0AAD9T0T1_9HELO|nr:hypothetical protein QTJ16_003216 [Diplocarpon rosae]PBP21392.1 hypothetical protein BUE80_DR007776 [Diplocarpon rosae]
MASEPTTPVRVPKAAATYSPTTQDPDLRSQINSVLLREGHITKIHDTLLHTLHSHPSNWPTTLQAHALSLLRSGKCTTFPELMQRVLQDIKDDTEAQSDSTSTSTGSIGKANGVKKKGEDDVPGSRGKGEGGASLALPRAVVEEGVRITRECLELVCEVPE